MSKVVQRSLREYYMLEHLVDLTTAAPVCFFPIPRSGQVDRCIITLEASHAGTDTTITFELGGVVLLESATAGVPDTATLTIPTSGSSTGIAHVINFDPLPAANYADEPETEDTIIAANRGVLEVISGFQGTAGLLGNVMIAVRRG